MDEWKGEHARFDSWLGVYDITVAHSGYACKVVTVWTQEGELEAVRHRGHEKQKLSTFTFSSISLEPGLQNGRDFEGWLQPLDRSRTEIKVNGLRAQAILLLSQPHERVQFWSEQGSVYWLISHAIQQVNKKHWWWEQGCRENLSA